MLALFLASGDTARGNKAKPLSPNIYILVVMTIKKEISKCQKLINAVEKNSELRSKGCWGTASLKKMPWEGVSEKVTFEQRCEGYEGTFWGVSGRRMSQAEGTAEAKTEEGNCEHFIGGLHLHFIGISSSPITVQFSSVHFSRSVVFDSLRPHGLQHAGQASLSITNFWSLLRLLPSSGTWRDVL